MIKRNAYLLTINTNSDRFKYCNELLTKIGFIVIPFTAIYNDNKVLSNKISMQNIYEIIIKNGEEWAYVFEDDIDLIEYINIDEIVQYESISEMFFYLGCCRYSNHIIKTDNKINNHIVYKVSNCVRGLHAIGLSLKGAKELLELSKILVDYYYMDVVLEQFCIKYPANVIRYDLKSYIYNHRGIFYQNRKVFNSLIST